MRDRLTDGIGRRRRPTLAAAPALSAGKGGRRPRIDKAAPRTAPAIGGYRIKELRPEQCRYACNDAGRDGHRFCGAPAPIGPGNPHGSWCQAHLALVFERASALPQPGFLKSAERGARR